MKKYYIKAKYKPEEIEMITGVTAMRISSNKSKRHRSKFKISGPTGYVTVDENLLNYLRYQLAGKLRGTKNYTMIKKENLEGFIVSMQAYLESKPSDRSDLLELMAEQEQHVIRVEEALDAIRKDIAFLKDGLASLGAEVEKMNTAEVKSQDDDLLERVIMKGIKQMMRGD